MIWARGEGDAYTGKTTTTVIIPIYLVMIQATMRMDKFIIHNYHHIK